jgi:hypothetical protein
LKAFVMLTWPSEDTRIRWEAGRILLLLYCTVQDVMKFLSSFQSYVLGYTFGLTSDDPGRISK